MQASPWITLLKDSENITPNVLFVNKLKFWKSKYLQIAKTVIFNECTCEQILVKIANHFTKTLHSLEAFLFQRKLKKITEMYNKVS